MIGYYEDLVARYPLVSIEDGLDENAWEDWRALTERLGDRTQLVGDDLFVTSSAFLERGISENVANAILVKVNQIGTLTEALDTVEVARRAGYGTVMSHRSGRHGGHDDRRPRRRDERRADQDGSAFPKRPGREVQPAPADRGGARRGGRVPRLGRVPSSTVKRRCSEGGTPTRAL